jgi:UDP-glucose 4-epimerase
MTNSSDHNERSGSAARPVAVVGANCPLGRHLVEYLLAARKPVLGLYRSGWTPPFDWTRNRAFHGERFDLNDARYLAQLLDATNQIIWLPQLREDPGSGQDINVEALHLVCSHTPTTGRKIVLLSSGGSIYGNPVSLPVKETHPCLPLNSYGLSKKRLEAVISEDVKRNPGLSGVVLRSANIYGRYWLEVGMRGCVGAFARSLIGNAPVTLIAGGRAVRDFVHVDDVNRAILLALACEESLAVWNVGSGQGIRILDLLCAMSQILGRVPQRFVYLDRRPSDVEEIVLDVERIEEACLWRPSIALHEGLRSALLPRGSFIPVTRPLEFDHVGGLAPCAYMFLPDRPRKERGMACKK